MAHEVNDPKTEKMSFGLKKVPGVNYATSHVSGDSRMHSQDNCQQILISSSLGWKMVLTHINNYQSKWKQ